MKGFLIACALSSLYAGFVVLWFRLATPQFRARFMMRAYLVSLPFLLASFAATPADLGFLPPALVERHAVLDAAFCLFAYSASVMGGWLQLYNLADRGLSLRILIDAAGTRDGVVSPASVETGYGAGKGTRAMYEKRLADLLRLGLLRREGGFVGLTERGRARGSLILWLRQRYGIPTRMQPAP